MSHVIYHPATVTVSTDENGSADFALEVPGTFSGFYGDGRYFKEVLMWSVSGADGDRVHNLRIEDVDRILKPNQNVTDNQMRVRFPDYPVIQYMDDRDIPAENRGVYLPVDYPIKIIPIDAGRGFQFIPAQLYICGSFEAGDSAQGRTLRINITWGKAINA